MVILIIFSLYAFIRLLLLQYSSKKWVPVAAKITSFSSENKSDEEGVLRPYFNVIYEYSYQDVKYSSNKISLISYVFGSSLYFSSSLSEKLKFSYNRNINLTIWVNPSNPSCAIILRESQVKNLVFFMLSVVTLSFILLKSNA